MGLPHCSTGCDFTRCTLLVAGERPDHNPAARTAHATRAIAHSRAGTLLLLLSSLELRIRRLRSFDSCAGRSRLCGNRARAKTQMSLASSLSRYVVHPLWDLKDGSRRLRILRELERSQWLPLDVQRRRQRERLERILQYAAAHSPYYQRLFEHERFDPENFQPDAFRALPPLTKAIIRGATDDILSDEFERSQLGVHKTGGSTGVALTTYFDHDWIETRTADAMRSDSGPAVSMV